MTAICHRRRAIASKQEPNCVTRRTNWHTLWHWRVNKVVGHYPEYKAISPELGRNSLVFRASWPPDIRLRCFLVGFRWQVAEKKWNEWGFMPILCTYRLNWARRTPADGEMNEMTLPSRHRIRNSSTLLLGHESSPRYWIITSERGRNLLLLWTWSPKWGSNPRSPTFRLSKQAALTTAPGLPPYRFQKRHCCGKIPLVNRLYL